MASEQAIAVAIAMAVAEAMKAAIQAMATAAAETTKCDGTQDRQICHETAKLQLEGR